MASRKITDLSSLTTTTADDLMVIVDMSGPTTYKMTIAAFTNAIPSNANFTANVAVQGTFTANAVTASGNVSFNTANYVTANNLVLKKTTTPANTTDVPGVVGSLWSDGSYIYYQANTTNVRRVAIATW